MSLRPGCRQEQAGGRPAQPDRDEPTSSTDVTGAERSAYHGVVPQVPVARRWVTVATGIAGVVVAHLVGHLLAFPDPQVRTRVLHRTGHGYFPLAAWAALGAAVVAVAAVAARGTAAGASHARPASAVPQFGRLAAWQAVLFLAVEAVERQASHALIGEMVHGGELWVGLVAQVLVAAALVVVLGRAERLGAGVAGAAERFARRRAPGQRLPRAPVGAPPHRGWVTTGSRAPPPVCLLPAA